MQTSTSQSDAVSPNIAALNSPNKLRLWKDYFLLALLSILAGCGLIYEYLLSHYAARVLGLLEPTIYGMIGTMIVAMGVGSLAARYVNDPLRGFAWLEWSVAMLGTLSILMIGILHGLVYLIPQVLRDVFILPEDIAFNGGIIGFLHSVLTVVPFVLGFILGALIGMEIPLLARIRQSFYQQQLSHNTGTLYGVDYIGAGIGALIWVVWMLSMPIMQAAVFTAIANAVVGLIFTGFFWRSFTRTPLFFVAQILLIIWIGLLFRFGDDWLSGMTTWLYQDSVVYADQTQYQNFLITEREPKKNEFTENRAPVYRLYLNGRLQFSSEDEFIYHTYLTYPAMLAAAKRESILVLGGGDGLALRDILKWNPQHIDLVDLDEDLVSFFRGQALSEKQEQQWSDHARVQQGLVQLNQNALNDPRVTLYFSNAFTQIDVLRADQKKYDVIIIDLPDPNHPDLNKLYSDHFYYRLKYLLNPGGAIAVQSTSPYHARKAFLSVAKTLGAVGYQVDSYHANVPSFGEWGWHLATLPVSKLGEDQETGRNKILQLAELPISDPWLNLDLLKSAFYFPTDFYADIDEIKINVIGTHRVYQYHHRAWQADQGVSLQLSHL